MANELRFLTPDYLPSDFNTIKTKLISLMKKSSVFEDMDFTGANITMILELVSYLGDLNTFYANLIAKNTFEESADIFETVHALTSQKGYKPKGYRSAEATFKVTVPDTQYAIGDQLYVSPWKSFNTTLLTDDGEEIWYTITNSYTLTPDTSGSFTFDIKAREGKIFSAQYTGDDIVDNSIILPFFKLDHGAYPYDVPSIELLVNGKKWDRVSDLYENTSGLINYDSVNDDVYEFNYDKYQQYKIVFSSARNVPVSGDIIEIKMLRSNGLKGTIGANIVSELKDEDFYIENITQSIKIYKDNITTFKNEKSSLSGQDFETMDEIKGNAKGFIHSQLRNITKKDYMDHLEARTDIIKGNAWGEQEVNPGNTLEYNKVHLSCIPARGTDTFFQHGTLETLGFIWSSAPSGVIQLPVEYNENYVPELLQYLEPRRALCVYEVFELPDLVYFKFEIGLRIKRFYDFIKVKEAVAGKLSLYFDATNRRFSDTINFMDIHNYLLDETVKNDEWFDSTQIKGVNNIVFRDVLTYTTNLTGNHEEIFEPNTSGNYPQFSKESFGASIDNIFRPIVLGYNQFPMVAIELCTFINEG